MDKFKNLTTEENTKILSRQEQSFYCYTVMMELWICDGIMGQSVIFDKNDVENISDNQLTKMIKEHYQTEIVTISRITSDFIFLNFNFNAIK